MRNLIEAINLTIDGCCDHTQVGIRDDELFDYSIRLVQDADALTLDGKRINCWFLLKRGAGHALLSPRRRS
ncbi:MAG: hypothetical protein ACXVBZ_09870 [Flavisolibacter sp.]